MGYLCKYLADEGWTPVVVTEQVPGDTFDFLCEGVDVTYVPASRMASLTDVFFGRKTARLERAAERKLAERPCDVVLCSTYREFPLAAARRIARRQRLGRPPPRVRTAGHPIYRPALPILPAWGNRSSLALGCPSNAADGTEQGLVFVGWPNRVPGGRLAESWISVLITLEITLNFVLRSARELVVHGPHAPRNPVEIRD